MPRRGLVIGKFYPPHRGHKYLIDTAQAAVDELHVILCRRPGENPPGELRASWLREIHPRARVLLIDDTLDPDDSAAWAAHSVRWLGFTPDVVFTSEGYGERFAACLGCEHVLVDYARKALPVSGTAVRADPLGNWEYLEPPVRAHYTLRVCLLGAESTGKTTLASDLARHFDTVWVPEYGRQHAERMLAEHGEYCWRTDDFVTIARTQCAWESTAAREANRLLLCDTDAFATAIWHERYLGFGSSEVEAIAAAGRRPDLYLIPDADTPFVQDGTRDGESIRRWMHDRFLARLEAEGRRHLLLSGSFAERFDQAVTAITQLLGRSGNDEPRKRTFEQS